MEPENPPAAPTEPMDIERLESRLLWQAIRQVREQRLYRAALFVRALRREPRRAVARLLRWAWRRLLERPGALLTPEWRRDAFTDCGAAVAARHKLAREMNEQLYSWVDPAQVQAVEGQITDLCRTRGHDEHYRRAWLPQAPRLAATVQALKGVLRRGCSVLDLGPESFSTWVLMANFPLMQWHSSNWDIRLRWPCSDESHDVILCTEVLEHLSDPPRGLNDSMRFLGATKCFVECCRVLRPGGALFVTTPNATSVMCIQQVLTEHVGFFFPEHVREYAREDLTRLAEETGFVVEQLRAIHCLTVGLRIDYSPLFEIMLNYGYPPWDRGDDWFMVCRKPGR